MSHQEEFADAFSDGYHFELEGGATRVIANSEMVKGEITAFYGYPAEQIDVAYNGVPVKSFRTTDAERALSRAALGLSDEEMRAVDLIIRRTTVESFGPVSSVTPTQVFELGFEGIARSTRHKSGIAVRFPRMLRWREDKPIAEADTLQTLQAMVSAADSIRDG